MSSNSPQNQNPPATFPLPPGVGPKNFPSLTDADVHLSNTTEFFNSFDNAFVHGPVSNLYNFFIKEKRKYIDPSPIATTDQISAFKEEAPGVNIPKGTKLNVAQFLTEDQKQQNVRDAVSSLAQPGITGTLSKATGSLLGTVAAPGNAITATVAPELVGVKSVAFGAAFGAEAQAAVEASPVLKNAIEGIAVGAGISVPAQAIQQLKNSAFNQNWSTWSALKNIGASMAVGGTIGAAFGSLLQFLPDEAAKAAKAAEVKTAPRETSPLQDAEPGTVGDKINKFVPFGDEASQQAVQTAIAQTFEGRDVNVDLILKNALKSNYNNFLNNMGQGEVPEALTLLEKSRGTIQRNLDKNLQEAQKVQSILDTKTRVLNPSQVKLFSLRDEERALNQQLVDHDAVTQKLREKAADVSAEDLKLTDERRLEKRGILQRKISAKGVEIQKIEPKVKLQTSVATPLRAQLFQLQGEKSALTQLSDFHDAFTKMLGEGVPDIEESDVKDYIDGNDPVKGAFQNSGVIEREPDLGEPIENEQNLLGDIFPKDYQKQLEENQGLTPEEKGVKSEITDRKTNEKTFNRMLAAAKNCLMGL